MSQYYVAYTKNICRKYKANIRSNVTLFLIINSVFCFILPFILAYNSNGFWIKEYSFTEQPLINFKYQYLIVLESIIVDIPTSIICTTYADIGTNFHSEVCSLLKVYETDENNDGKNDRIHMRLRATNVSANDIRTIHLFLIFDYKIYSECVLEMEMITATSYAFPQPVGKLDIVSELITNVRQPIQCDVKSTKKRENSTITSLISNFTNKYDLIREIISYYATKSVNAKLKNLYYMSKYKNEIAENEPFEITVDIHYSEQQIRYRSRFWQLIKGAWIQYFSIMALSVLISRKIKKFIFENRVLQTIEECPFEE